MQVAQDAEMQKMQEKEKQKEEMEERKRIMIRQLLEPEALERLHRIGMVKPEKKAMVENAILNQAQSGGMMEKVSETHLIALMEKIDAATAPAASTVKFQRKKRADSDDDIDLDNL